MDTVNVNAPVANVSATPQVAPQVAGFFDDLQEYGEAVYGLHKEHTTVNVNDDPSLEIVQNDKGYSIKLRTPQNTAKYIPIKGNRLSDSGIYGLSEFIALRDWQSDTASVSKGNISKFAVAK